MPRTQHGAWLPDGPQLLVLLPISPPFPISSSRARMCIFRGCLGLTFQQVALSILEKWRSPVKLSGYKSPGSLSRLKVALGLSRCTPFLSRVMLGSESQHRLELPWES